jgi:glutamine amidotransferase
VTLIAVLDYGIGNLRSAQKALQHVGADARLTSDPGLIREAAGVVLPGVGSFGRCMEELRRSGLDQFALESIEADRPFLGICVGMQMLFERGEEGDTPGLGLLAGGVPRFPNGKKMEGLKIPHMGWNEVRQARPHPVWEGVPDGSRFYFVHSYYPQPADGAMTAATCAYGVTFTCAIARDNIFAVQFHPEKSQTSGLRLLSNFVQWRP